MANLKSILKSTFLAGAVALSSISLYPGEANAKKVYRNDVSMTTNYVALNINGQEYQKGVSFGLESRLRIPVFSWLDIHTELGFDHQNYSSSDRKATEAVEDLEFELAGRVELYSSGNINLHLDLGGKYLLNHEGMVFEEDDAYLMQNFGGPSLTVGLESNYLDFAVSFSELFGIRSASYERSYNYRAEQLSISFVPRFWRVEVSAGCELLFQEAVNYNGYRPSLMLKLTLKPEIDLTEHVAAVMNIAHSTILFDCYEVLEIGVGVKIKW